MQSLDQLIHDHDVRVMPVDLTRTSVWGKRDTFSLSVPKSAMRLKSVSARINAWSQKCTPMNDTKWKIGKFCPLKSQTKEQLQEDEPDEIMEEDLIEPYSEVFLTIRVMVPLKYHPVEERTSFKMDREIVVLGENFLSDFRDMISCICDSVGPFTDHSEDPESNYRAIDKYADKTNSGFLFIGDTLYVDTRNPKNLDTSKEVIAWAKSQTSEVGELKRAIMEKTRFRDLKGIQLGFPYVYQHFGECEHMFLFSDIQVVGPGENHLKSDYPYLQLSNNFRNVRCDICAHFEASHSVTGSSQHIFDPVRLCAKCLNSYHYVDGKKIGDFAAYRFRK